MKCRQILNGIEKSDDKRKCLDRYPYRECDGCPYHYNNHCPVANYNMNDSQKKKYEQLWEWTKKINRFFEKDISCYDNDPLTQRKIMFG